MRRYLNKKTGFLILALALSAAITYSQENTTTPKYTDAQISKIMDKNSYPNYDKDKAALEQFKPVFIRNGESYNYKTSIPKLECLKQVNNKLDSAEKAYGEYWKIYEQQMKKKDDFAYLCATLKKEIKNFEDYIKNTSSSLGNPVYTVPAKFDDALALAKTTGDNVLNSERYKAMKFSERQTYAKSEWYKVDSKILDADYSIAVLKYQKGDNYEGLPPLMKKREETVTQINALKSDFDNKMVEASKTELAKVTMPAEIYSGADKEKLREKIKNAWATSIECKDFKLLKVIFNNANWEKKEGTEYNRNIQNNNQITGTDFSYSFLEVTVIFQRPSDNQEISSMFEAEVSKDNTNKTVQVNFICGDELSFRKILTKNVK